MLFTTPYTAAAAQTQPDTRTRLLHFTLDLEAGAHFLSPDFSPHLGCILRVGVNLL